MAGAERARNPHIVHATTVSYRRRALLIRGPSGSGKSGLALALLARGADLVSDDRTHLTPRPDGPPVASAPDPIRGLIEARGVGLMAVAPASPAPVVAVVELGETEAARLPPRRTTRLLNWEVDLFHKPATGPFPDVLFLYLSGKACLN